MISVVIPALNEARYINKTLKDCYEYFSRREAPFELIVVDDGSRDGTSGKVEEFAVSHHGGRHVKLIRNRVNRGKGYSLRRGVLQSRGNIVLITDTDLSTPLREFEKMSAFIPEYDIVIASRGLKESKKLIRQTWLRGAMGRIFNLLVRTFLFDGYYDTQCGFKIFKGDAARYLFRKQKIRRFAFDIEVLGIAIKKGYKIKEVPVHWINRRETRVRIVRDSLDMFFSIFRLRRILKRC